MTLARLLVSRFVAVVVAAATLVSVSAQTPGGGQVTPPRASSPAGAAVKGTAVLKGVVVAADTGAPIRRVHVRAMAVDGRDNRATSTDEQGRFELRELLGGRYSVMASRSGFVTLQYGQRHPRERGTPVDVAAGVTVEKLTIGLPRGGVITGRIVDEFGEPLAGAQVQVLRYQFAPGGRRLMPAGIGDRTDDLGSFRIYGLMPGEFVVSATLNERSMIMMAPPGGTAQDDSLGYAPTYYPGTPSMADAERVTVAVGQEVSGISFGLASARLARIGGRVVGPAGAPVEGMVNAMPDDPAMVIGDVNRFAQIRADGVFAVEGLSPGRYLLRVEPRWGQRSDDDLVGTTTVTVAGVDLANVTIPILPRSVVSGRIEFEGGVPPSVRASEVQVSLMATDTGSGRMFLPGPPKTADDFTFTLRGAAGTALIRAFGAPGWYLKAVELSGQDITDTPVTFAPGRNVSGVRVLLTQAASSVSGTVRDDRGNVVLDSAVVVFPADDAKWAFGSRFIRSTRPDTNGRFEIKGLPAAADYRILAVLGLEDGQAFDPDFLRDAVDRGDRLGLAWGETKTVDLRLRP